MESRNSNVTDRHKNIRKIEKNLGFFLNNGNISIQSNSYQSILFSIKNIFDEKKLDKKVIANLVQSCIQKFYIDEHIYLLTRMYMYTHEYLRLCKHVHICT